MAAPDMAAPRRRLLPDVLGVAWTVVAVVAVMAPALRPGVSLGPFDLLSRVGLTRQPHVAVHDLFPSDQVLQSLPWINLAWHQVHHGHLPLWNPYNVLGTPLAFNWQSGVFSLPMAVSYLFPVHLAYTVVVLVKLVTAGTGAYFLCRVLRLRPVAATFAGVSFALSGPMLHYSGWSMTSVTSWSGWIIGSALLVARGDHRLRDCTLLALFVALAVYGGHPESLAVMGVCLALFFVVHLGLSARRQGRSPWRPLGLLAGSTVAGLGLSAPLLLPGLQLGGGSIRNTASGAPPYPIAHLADFVVALQGQNFRVPPPYLGALPVALAVVAVVVLRRRRTEVVGFAAVAVLAVLCTYHTPFYDLFQAVPKVGLVTLNRAVMLLALSLSVLAAFGLELLVGDDDKRTALRRARQVLAGAAVVIALVGAAVAAGVYKVAGGSARSFAWPCAEVVAASAVLWWMARRHADRPGTAIRGALALVGLQTVVLVASGVSFWSLSSTYFAPTPGVSALSARVGDGLVSAGACRPSPFGQPSPSDLGIRPDANIAYSVSEFDVYDATLPAPYFHSWHAAGGQPLPRPLVRVGIFCPTITSAGQARLYGIDFVLTAPGQPGPAGTRFVSDIAGERLFAVPGAAQATLLPRPAPGERVALEARGAPVPVTHPGPASWTLHVHSDAPGLLRLRLTAVPGWHATVDGRPVALEKWASKAMLELRVPPGSHVVELHYWPTLLSAGLVLAAVDLGVLAGLAAWSARRPARPAGARREAADPAA